MNNFTALAITLAIFLSGCTPMIPQSGVSTPIEITAVISTVIPETSGTPSTEGPSPTFMPSASLPTLPSSILSPTELKYKVFEQFPDFFFCDPDYYPIAREDELVLALRRFPELQANLEEFKAILSHNGLNNLNTFTDDQKLLIYREHKKLNAIYFELVNDKFQFQIQTGSEGQQGFFITGIIDGKGSIEILEQNPSFPTCPICLAAGTLIDTPQGSVTVENLQVGDLVWTLDISGERIQAPILKTSRVAVPPTHQVIHVILSGGRELWASPRHPTADGRILGDLKMGDFLDGARVEQVELVPYDLPATYDLLPSGNTGVYWANGILIGSTLVNK